MGNNQRQNMEDVRELIFFIEGHNFTEALYISGAGNFFLENQEELLDSMIEYLNIGYQIRDGIELGMIPEDMYLYMTDDQIQWWKGAKLLVADKYNSERGFYLVR